MKHRTTHLLRIALFFSCIAGSARATEIENIHSAFGSDACSQITVSWRSPFYMDEKGKTPAHYATVEYGITPTYGTTAEAATLESAGGLQHHAELTALLSSTTYHYRVHSGANIGPDCTFRTALPPDTKEAFTFAVIGDVEGGANGNPFFPALTKWLTKKDLAFFIVMGDLAYYGQQQSGWDGFFNNGSVLFESCVFAPVLGDHGMERLIAKKGGGTVTGREAPWLYLDQFLLPDNGTEASSTYGRHSLRGFWYAFDYGSAHIISMENTDELTAPFRESVAGKQPAWVKNDFLATKATWRFLMSHRVFYPYESEETQWDFVNKRRLDHRTQWDEILAASHVDLAFGAHIGGWIISHPIVNGKIAQNDEHGTIHIKLAKLGNYAHTPDQNEVAHWATALPETSEKIPALIQLITVRPNQTDVVSWDWVNNREYHRFSLKPHTPKK